MHRTPTKRMLIVQTGRAIASVRARLGDFPHWFRVAMGLPRNAVEIVDVQHGDSLPSLLAGEARWALAASDRADEAPHHGYAGIVITGSNSMVSEREPWSETTAEWIRAAHAANTPLLGVCYGHQLIAHAFGGRVDYHPQGREMGTQTIERLDSAEDDALWHDAPSRFVAHLTHRQSVLGAPCSAVILARSAHDPCQALRIGERTWGVQFHPEFSTAAMSSYIAARGEELLREGNCPRTLARGVRAAPHARAILRRFARLAFADTAGRITQGCGIGAGTVGRSTTRVVIQRSQ
ncbi:MAG: glutamine amidotransferase [Lysobacterales bacterium]